MKVLVDTSVWVAHFKDADQALMDLLEADRVVTHPMVLGEIACGTPPDRKRMLADLCSLQQTNQATLQEVMVFVERERFFSRGCGLVDMVLLASTMMTPGTTLWTSDRRLAELAEPLGMLHRVSLH